MPLHLELYCSCGKQSWSPGTAVPHSTAGRAILSTKRKDAGFEPNHAQLLLLQGALSTAMGWVLQLKNIFQRMVFP